MEEVVAALPICNGGEFISRVNNSNQVDDAKKSNKAKPRRILPEQREQEGEALVDWQRTPTLIDGALV
jgi:hypothetical protein